MNYDSLSAGDLMAGRREHVQRAEVQGSGRGVREAASEESVEPRRGVQPLRTPTSRSRTGTSWSEVGKQLTLIEPLNEDAYRLTGQAYRELKQQDSLLKEAERLVGLPIAVDVNTFAMGTTASRIEATATGRKATDANGKDIKPTPWR
jgi:hypothetical protein